MIFFRYYLKGPKKGQHEVFLNLPGFPDNVRLSDRNTLLVALVIARKDDFLRKSVLDLLGEYPFIRTVIGRVRVFIVKVSSWEKVLIVFF